MAFDLYKEIREYLFEGIISATIEQNVKKQMQKAFEALVGYLINNSPVPKTIYTDVQLVLKSNMHQFK